MSPLSRGVSEIVQYGFILEDENGNPITSDTFPFIELRDAAKYSELIQKFPIHGEIGDDDIIQLSHKLENGKYETCYVTISQLKQALK